jgi:hypothetical protein
VAAINSVSTPEPKEDDDTDSASDTSVCDSTESLARLSILPRSNIVAPFDFGPTILALTKHNVLATSHHRNSAAMADQIRLFTSASDKARSILAARNIAYIIACPKEDELKIYRERNPESFVADLLDEKAPDWLQSVHIRDSTLMVWRVVPKELHTGS